MDVRHSFKRPHVLSVAGKRVVLALEWHPVASAQDTQSVKRATISSEGRFGVLLDRSGFEHDGNTSLVGIAARVEKLGKSYRKSVAGAALGASLSDECFCMVLPVGSGKWWYSAYVDGMPIVGRDLVAEEEIVLQCVREMRKQVPKVALRGDSDFFAKHYPDDVYTPATFESLVDGERYRVSPRLMELRKDRKAQIRMAIPLVAMVATLIFFAPDIKEYIETKYLGYDKSKTKDEWVAQIEREKALLVQEYNKVAANHPLNSWIDKLAFTLEKLPFEAGGWHLSAFRCSSGLPYCLAKWKRQNVGTYATLERYAGHIGDLKFDKQEASQKVEINNFSATTFDDRAVFSLINEMPDIKKLNSIHLSTLQKLGSIKGVFYTVKNSKKVGQYDEPPPEVAPLLDRDYSFPPFYYGEWTLKGKGLGLLIGSLQSLDSYVYFGRSLLLDVIYTENEANVNWEIEGYYVHQD